jgi:hypothetical protein
MQGDGLIVWQLSKENNGRGENRLRESARIHPGVLVSILTLLLPERVP